MEDFADELHDQSRGSKHCNDGRLLKPIANSLKLGREDGGLASILSWVGSEELDEFVVQAKEQKGRRPLPDKECVLIAANGF